MRLAKKLGLEKHPEGGYFKQTYRSETTVNVKGYEGPRNIATAIYYMLVGKEFSAFIGSDRTKSGTITLEARLRFTR